MASEATHGRARFFMDAVLNEFKTRNEGRPIYDDIEMVEVRIPGEKNMRLVFLADEPFNGNGETRIERYPEEYAAFKRGEQRAVTGTPLEAWPILTKSQVLELKAANILSVDELADLPDSSLKKIGSKGRELREQARAFKDAAKGGAEVLAQAARIASLEAMVAQLLKGGAGPAPSQQAIAEPVEKTEKAISDCTDDELKAFIKEKTGEAPRGRPLRETLVERATELATQEPA
jgi:hypothetical protein